MRARDGSPNFFALKPVEARKQVPDWPRRPRPSVDVFFVFFQYVKLPRAGVYRRCSRCLISLALPRGIEPLFSP
jgi:hypothetical protein